MSSMDLVLSEKYKAFLKCQTPVEFLEGTTAAGKTGRVQRIWHQG